MGNKLLVRVYNVGFGDCIYVRIPSSKGGFHVLIDCGTLGSVSILRSALEDLKRALPDSHIPGKKRLDLVVATHRHADHIKGFELKFFEDIEVRNIWVSAGMDPNHPQAEKTRKLRMLAETSMRRLVDSGKPLSGEVSMLASFFSASNQAAETLITKTLPELNKIKPKFVHSQMTRGRLELENLPPKTSIEVLGPEKDIDGYYLGKTTDEMLTGLKYKFSAGISSPVAMGKHVVEGQGPKNISTRDFDRLRSRMGSNGLEFARNESAIQNNLSVVLLITWRKRRLLFVGDAEWNGEYKEGKQNGGWNVMWKRHCKGRLATPIDFLKVGHHGSRNSTPWISDQTKRKESQKNLGIGSLLDALLPVPSVGSPSAGAIVSTQRSREATIPDGPLMVELGKRVKTARKYSVSMSKKGIDPRTIWESSVSSIENVYQEHEKPHLNKPQPWRTDLEGRLTDGADLYTQIEFDPGD
ncbi:MAG: ComEC/Rec2 family competence protein [Pirellula sp.]